MKTRYGVLALFAAALLLAAGGGTNPPLDARVRTLEDRLAAVEKRLGEVEGQLAAARNAALKEPLPGQIYLPADAPVEIRSSVKEVIDGATLRLASGETVRLIGVDTSGAPTQSASALTALVSGKIARLEFDVAVRDRSGAFLAYVYVGNRFTNAELIDAGWAKAVTTPPNTKHSADFQRLQQEAKTNRRGMWAGQN